MAVACGPPMLMLGFAWTTPWLATKVTQRQRSTRGFSVCWSWQSWADQSSRVPREPGVLNLPSNSSRASASKDLAAWSVMVLSTAGAQDYVVWQTRTLQDL